MIVFLFIGECNGGFNGVEFCSECGYVGVIRVNKEGVIDVSIVYGIGWYDAFERTGLSKFKV